MIVTFLNVELSVEAESPRAAYDKLADFLDVGVRTGLLEYSTDTFVTDSDDDPKDTAELWGGV